MELNNHWINIPLEDLTVHVIGGDWGKESDFIEDGYEAVACIRGSEFKHWKIDFGRTAVIRKIKISSMKTRALLKGDILVEISGGGPEQPVGRTVLISDTVLKQHNLPVVCTNFIRMMRLAPCINSVFVNRYLELFYLSGEVIKYQGGSNNLRNLKFKDYSKINIPLPSYAEQKIIADKLDDLLARVESIKTRLENIPEILKRFRQSVLSTEFDYEIDDFSSLKNMELKDICRSISDGDHQAPPKSNSGIPFLVISDVNKGVVDFDNVVRRVPLEYYENLKDIRKPDEKDILYTVTGSFGIPVVITDNAKFCFQRHIAIIKPNHELIFYKYLYFYLKSPEVFKYAQRVATGTAQKTVSLSNLRKFKIRLPSIFLQKKVVRKIEALFLYADTIEKKSIEAMKNINQLTQPILAKAFRGELTAQWREENPELISGINSAEALLEKITAEKLAAGTIKKRAKKSSH
ncbi:restriction endonuclease subunit S [Klebsiella pneumoniae]